MSPRSQINLVNRCYCEERGFSDFCSPTVCLEGIPQLVDGWVIFTFSVLHRNHKKFYCTPLFFKTQKVKMTFVIETIISV